MATRGKKEKKYPPMPANWMYKRGDVYMMDLNPYSGSEQGGIRPAIVVQNDDGNFYSNVLLVVPLTTQIKKRNMPTHFILHNRFLSAPSMAICESPRPADKSRVLSYLGHLSKYEMNAVVKPYHEMCLNSSELIVPRDTYQRALHPARVARIAKEFDERVANEPKISFRDGHYYVMDGQNTIAARKFLNGGEDLQIRCKVYFGMTEREEALLFAQQTGISERLSAGQKLRALIFAGEPAAVAFQQATELAGVHLSFEEGRGKQRISCIATAYHEFIRLGPELYIESLDVLLNAWDGEPDSMSSANLLGICRFVELYHSEYSKSRLIAKLRQVDAFTIFRLARTAGVSLPGKTKYLQQVYTIYNGGSRRAALPLKF